MKKKIFIFSIVLLLLASCNFCPELTSETFSFREPDMDLSSEDILGLDYYISANFTYPQVNGGANSFDKINQCLKYVSFDLVGLGQFQTEGLLNEEFILLPEANGVYFGNSESTFQTIYLDEQYLSIAFEMTVSDRVRVNTDKCLLTFNLNSDELISLESLYSKEEVQEMILAGEYEVREGSYFPDGWVGNEAELKSKFIDCVDAQWHRVCDDSDRIVDSSSMQNFGLTKDSIIIKFRFEDSLNGFVILELKR